VTIVTRGLGSPNLITEGLGGAVEAVAAYFLPVVAHGVVGELRGTWRPACGVVAAPDYSDIHLEGTSAWRGDRPRLPWLAVRATFRPVMAEVWQGQLRAEVGLSPDDAAEDEELIALTLLMLEAA
jgi:hypothetical protein